MATERGRVRSTFVVVGVWLSLVLSLASLTHAQPQVEAGKERSYLAELALLVDGERRLIVFCEHNRADRELAKFAQPLAERYVEMANRMLPPPKVVVAHPHLLLVVENLERAVDALANGNLPAFQRRMRIARDELANLEAVLKQLKLKLPEPPR